MASQQPNFEVGVPSQQPNHAPNPDFPPYAVPHPNYMAAMPNFVPQQEPLHAAFARAGSFAPTENNSPAPEDSEAAENGLRRKKVSATSIANDAELRRLLYQNQGKKLDEIAVEVQRSEGGDGRSEKAKQVFAMLW